MIEQTNEDETRLDADTRMEAGPGWVRFVNGDGTGAGVMASNARVTVLLPTATLLLSAEAARAVGALLLVMADSAEQEKPGDS